MLSSDHSQLPFQPYRQIEMNNIYAFFVTTNALSELGPDLSESAFNWDCPSPSLKRVTVGDLSAGKLEEWRDVCQELFIEPLLVLGPNDVTPDVEKHPALLGLDVVTAHRLQVLDMPDMPTLDDLRQMIVEPDEVFTLDWSDFAAGERMWFAPPGPLRETGEPFWKAYTEALSRYKGSIFDQEANTFFAGMREAWSAPLLRDDLGPGLVGDNGGIRYPLNRFRFCALRFDPSSQDWTTEGWLPTDIEVVDPDRKVRNALEADYLQQLAIRQEQWAREKVAALLEVLLIDMNERSSAVPAETIALTGDDMTVFPKKALCLPSGMRLESVVAISRGTLLINVALVKPQPDSKPIRFALRWDDEPCQPKEHELTARKTQLTVRMPVREKGKLSIVFR